MRLRWAGGAGLAIAGAITAAVTAWPAPGEGGAAAPRLAAPARAAYDVTLVTGDRVHVSPVAGGRHTVTVRPAHGPQPRYFVHESGDDLFVIPSDVATLVPARLDPALFNVTELAEHGYANRPLPLIVTYEGGTAAAPPGTTRTHTLESVRGVAVEAPGTRADRLGRALAQLPAGPLARVDKIWLDRRVEAALDRSVPQIGAPAVWQAGHDGSGVTVAVVDSGIDTTHPDLAGAVIAERNFTEEPDATDRFGHGTHLAAIVASRATTLRGVAPGAQLINGKVLDADGFGSVSGVIDAMEWASTAQDADVVNVSLTIPTDAFEAGPVAEAVDRLSAENGTLFVVAAGNDGCDACVTSPGIVERALTVGAVDDDDVLADFSNRGPLPDTFVLKPDLTAPGVGIAAARAAGTQIGDPVGDLHVNATGTSMATAHVAGAAALLLDSRPDATAEALKAALMSTAAPSPDTSVYAQGAGRVDVARAVASPVVAETGSLSFGHFRFPHGDRPPLERTIVYRNRSAAPVELDLEAAVADAEGQPVAAGAIGVEPAQVTVPAGGTTSVRVTLDTRRPAPGQYTGHVLAQLPGGATLRTIVGFAIEPEMFDVRVRGIARDGRRAFGGFTLMDVRDSTRINARRWLHGEDGPCTSDPSDVPPCVRVPRGTYSLTGLILTNPAHVGSTEQPRTVLNTSLMAIPEVEIARDTELVLDARKAKEVVVQVPERDAVANPGGALEVAIHRAPEQGPGATDWHMLGPGLQIEEKFFVQPTEPVRHGEFEAYTRWQLGQPEIRLDVAGSPRLELHPTYYDPMLHSANSWEFPKLAGVRSLEVVDAGTGTAADVERAGVHGKLALVRRSNAISVPAQAANAAAAGAAMVAVYNDRRGHNADPGEFGVPLPIPTVRLTGSEGVALRGRLASGRVHVRAEGIPASRYWYDLVLVARDRIPERPHYVLREQDLARVDMRFHGPLDAPVTYSHTTFPYRPWQDFSTSVWHPLQSGPRVRQDWYSTVAGTRWTHNAGMPELAWNPTEERAYMLLSTPETTAYRPGERRSVDWFRAPLAPGLNPQQPLQRAENLMRISMAGFVDGAGNHGGADTSLFPNGFVTRFRMFEDDKLLVETDRDPQGILDVAEGPASYRIEYDVANHAPWARLSTDTQTVWTFRSSRPPEGEIVTPPLLTVDWDVDVDLRNRLVPGGHRIDVTVGHQPGAPDVPLRSVALDVSYDDGATWRPVGSFRPVRRGHWRAELVRRLGVHVSLRLRAEDVEGNSITQRITRAYAIPGRAGVLEPAGRAARRRANDSRSLDRHRGGARRARLVRR